MKPWAFLFFSAVCKVLAQGSRPGDGLVVVGFDITDIAITYHSVRWEPLCGTVTYVGPTLDRGTSCVPAINQYTNYTGSTLAFYDFAGVKLSNTGVGLGTDLCLCFSMSTITASAYDICWAYNAIGQFVTESHGWQIGSFRSGAIKSLPQCGNVNVDALQAAWSRTAVMPQATGTAQTLDPGPSAIDHTVTQLQTLTLTPTCKRVTSRLTSLTPRSCFSGKPDNFLFSGGYWPRRTIDDRRPLIHDHCSRH